MRTKKPNKVVYQMRVPEGLYNDLIEVATRLGVRENKNNGKPVLADLVLGILAERLKDKDGIQHSILYEAVKRYHGGEPAAPCKLKLLEEENKLLRQILEEENKLLRQILEEELTKP